MRVLLLRVLVLAGGIALALALAPAAAQVPRRLTADEHDQKLLKAQKIATQSATDKKGSFKVAKIPNVTDKPIEALARTIPPRPADLRRLKASNRSVQKGALRAGAHLDPAFDLRTFGDFPIQNQDQCGCCWIFGAVGAFEGNLLFKNKSTALGQSGASEQYVLDRLAALNAINPCDGGWFEMSLNFLRDEGTGTRAQFPYSGGMSAGRADRAASPPFKARAAGYVGNSDSATPSVTEIKQAIAAYGAVTVAVYVGDAFQSYTSGLFGRGEPDAELPNHAVALVGWDDNPPEFNDDPALRAGTGGGVWILRNSWGPAWGEKGGYMRIAYNSSYVGYGAMWVDVDGGTIDPIKPDPKPGNTYPQQIQDRIKFYEQNYPQYVPKP